ncbi:MAG: hypothetical protein ABIQ72_19750 [Usitatibacter sp.]
MDPDELIRRKLDAVVGESFNPPRKLRPTLLKWGGAAILAVATAAAIVAIIHANLHLRESDVHAPKKPVPINIVPAR